MPRIIIIIYCWIKGIKNPFAWAYKQEIDDYKSRIKGRKEQEKIMNKKLAKLTVEKSADYYNKVVKALEDAGFVIVLDCETTTERYYIIAESEDER